MVGAPSTRAEEQARLSGARAEFVETFPNRVEVLRGALRALEQAPDDVERRQGFVRRVHALAAAARVLEYTNVAEVLTEAERALRSVGRGAVPARTLGEVARSIELLPTLLEGAPHGAAATRAEPGRTGSERGYPISVLVFGLAPLAEALLQEGGASRIELERCVELEKAFEVARTLAPDVAVVDADSEGAKALVGELADDAQLGRVSVLVLGSFGSAEAGNLFRQLGAERVLTKPVTPELLQRAVLELHDARVRPQAALEPVGELTVSALAERIATEINKGLVASVEASGQTTRVDFGEGSDVLAAVWGAVARVRELTTVRSAGAVRFAAGGPEGAVPFVPFNDERRAGQRGARYGRRSDDVALQGRRVVVADDDPAVVWFMTGLLRAVGAEVLDAHDGDRALERVFESSPDVVVSDILMPGRDGFSLCHEIKRDVIARDIPVVLLSWKEDLLQRVRELGADADGYLRKEAAASTVVERLREVLRPRARVEQRLAAGGEARGRLDGITPRLVLDLVCRFSPDATLTLRDAVYLYEVQVRSGQVRSATRSAADGSFERGPRVFSSLLGVNAGRFAVQPDATPCRAELEGSLAELLQGPVQRARAALAAVSAQSLAAVVSVRIDADAVGRYLDCTPEPLRVLLEKLTSGAEPRALLRKGETSPLLLEAVLSDLARRGAIVSVEREEGLVPGLAHPAGDAVLNARSAPRAATAPRTATPESSARAPEPAAAPEQNAELEGEGFSFQLDATPSAKLPPAESRQEPQPPARARLAPTDPQAKARELEPAEDESFSVFSALASETESPPDVKPAAEPGARAERVETPSTHAAGARPGRRPAVQVPDSFDAPSPSMADVFAAALAAAPEDEDPASDLDASAASAPALRVAPDLSRPAGPAAAPLSRGDTRPAPATDESSSVFEGTGPATLRGLSSSVPPPPPAPAQPLATVTLPGIEPPPSPATREPVSQAAAVPVSQAAAVPVSQAAAAVPPSEPPPRLPADVPDPAEESEPVFASAPEAPQRVGAPPRPLEPSTRTPEVALRPAEPTAHKASGVSPAPAVPAPSSSGTDVSSVARTLGLSAAAFGVAFALVRWVVVPALAPTEEAREPTASPSAMVAAALGSAAPPSGASASTRTPVSAPSPVAGGMRLSSEDLPLPPDIAIAAGSGLIEIHADATAALYVDGVLVGRGPRRPVPVPAGKHEVKVARDEGSASISVDVAAGRRSRVSVTPARAPGPHP